jgi:ABC-type uncharacterized transport system permease subunit
MSLSTEPVVVGNSVPALLAAVLALLKAFNIVDFSADQLAALLAVVTTAIAVVSVVIRSKVTPDAKAARP